MSSLKVSKITLKLHDIGKDITEGECTHLKLLCSDFIPAGTRENIKTPYALFIKIKELTSSDDELIEYLSDLFINIQRKDLFNKLNDIAEPESKQQINSPQCAAKLQKVDKKILMLVEEKITGDWMRLGRYLNVDDSSLEGVDTDHKKVKDKAFRMLKAWEKENWQDFSEENLLKALDDVGRRDIVAEIAELKRKNNETTLNAPVQESGSPSDELSKMSLKDKEVATKKTSKDS